MLADPEQLGFQAQDQLSVQAHDPCDDFWIPTSGYFSGWDSRDHSIATLNSRQITGVGPGSTNAFASGQLQKSGYRHCTLQEFFPQNNTNVMPTVTISGPSNVPMLKAGYQGSDSITLTATGNPAGGTYSWIAVSGQGNITILNSTSQSAIIQSVAVGTYTVQVTYTYNGKPGTAVAAGRVQQPGNLSVFSDTGSTLNNNCRTFPPDDPPYTGGQRQIVYDVLDTSSQLIPAAGMNAQESFTSVSNNCTDVSNVPQATQTSTLSNGNFAAPDILAMCSISCLPADSHDHPLGACQLKVNQTWSVNGYAVQTKQITYQCASVNLQ
jgi:hypothetical protein